MNLTTSLKNSTSFRLDAPLQNDQLLRIAPSIFALEPHSSRSEKYSYIPTINVLEGLRKEGFMPFMVAQSRSRIEGKSEYTKHMLRLRHVNDIIKDEANEIVLVNSHDGTSSYQMLAGVLRFVCSNGMVTGDLVQDIRVPHRGNVTDNVIEAAYTIVKDFDKIDSSIEDMKSIQLLPSETSAFADAALTLKYDDYAPIASNQLLRLHRYEDKSNDLWTTLNKVQENLMRGGQRGRTATGARTTTRAVNSIDNNIKLNKALWVLADKMAEIKNNC
jgi:hypothetical protein